MTDWEMNAIYHEFKHIAMAFGAYLGSAKADRTIHRLIRNETYTDMRPDTFNDDTCKCTYERADDYYYAYNHVVHLLNAVVSCLHADKLSMAEICLFKARGAIHDVDAIASPELPIKAPVADSETLHERDLQFERYLKKHNHANE